MLQIPVCMIWFGLIYRFYLQVECITESVFMCVSVSVWVSLSLAVFARVFLIIFFINYSSSVWLLFIRSSHINTKMFIFQFSYSKKISFKLKWKTKNVKNITKMFINVWLNLEVLFSSQIRFCLVCFFVLSFYSYVNIKETSISRLITRDTLHTFGEVKHQFFSFSFCFFVFRL